MAASPGWGCIPGAAARPPREEGLRRPHDQHRTAPPRSCEQSVRWKGRTGRRIGPSGHNQLRATERPMPEPSSARPPATASASCSPCFRGGRPRARTRPVRGPLPGHVSATPGQSGAGVHVRQGPFAGAPGSAGGRPVHHRASGRRPEHPCRRHPGRPSANGTLSRLFLDRLGRSPARSVRSARPRRPRDSSTAPRSGGPYHFGRPAHIAPAFRDQPVDQLRSRRWCRPAGRSCRCAG